MNIIKKIVIRPLIIILALINLVLFETCHAKLHISNKENNRIEAYHTITQRLKNLSDARIQELLENGTKLGSGWGDTMRLDIDGIPVFVKQVPVTTLEALPENMHSTKNLFGLPLFYQYGIGSAGFGVWRELESHIMATNWVLTGKCPNFPLLYGWRMLPAIKREPLTTEQHEWFEKNIAYWENSREIRNRLEAIFTAPSNVVLFLEYIPDQLDSWLTKEFAKGDDAAQSASRMVLANLESITTFMHSQRFVHFDAHFGNILTDGKRLYLTDFGLALSSKFKLSRAELEFFRKHRNYDKYYTIGHFIEWIVTTLFGAEEGLHVLQEYANGQCNKKMAPFIQEIVTRYTPLALTMIEFERQLRTESKKTAYPMAKLEHLYREATKKSAHKI